MNKQIGFGIYIVLLVVFLLGCSRSEHQELTVYSAGPRSLIKNIIQAYEEEKGVSVRWFSATTGQVLAKLEAEKYNPRADVVVLASRLAAEGLKDRGFIRSFELTNSQLTPEEWHDAEGYYYSTAAAYVGIALNEGISMDVSDWKSVLEMEHGYALVMPSPNRSGSAADFLNTMSEKWGTETSPLFMKAKTKGFDFAAANSQALASLLSGAYDGIFGAADYLVFKNQAKGERLTMYYPSEGCPLIQRPIALMAGSKKTEEALDFIHFYFSERAQQEVAKAHLIPARSDITLSTYRRNVTAPTPILSTNMYHAYKRHRTLLTSFRYIENAIVE